MDTIKFVIIMATYCRKNKKSPSYLDRSLNSIINQTYKNWDLIIVGDKYEPENELIDIINNFKTKIGIENNIIYLKNIQTERDYIKDKQNLWTCAGATSLNMGLNYARNNNYKYYCHLDDDDFWNSNHLEVLANIYVKYPNCVFANTQAMYIKRHLPQISNITIYENNMLPTPCGMIHSSYSFRIDILKFDYYTNYTNVGRYYASDADMLKKIKEFLISNKEYHSIYIPILTCNHLDEGESVR
jgi:glycosyltransferase involved in cell wall biosynthesis